MTGVILAVLLALTAGGVALEIFLARRESRWPGLVLPLLSLLFSLVGVLNVSVSGTNLFPWGPLLAAFLLGNIPTLILLAVYRAARERRRMREQIDKMNIEDL